MGKVSKRFALAGSIAVGLLALLAPLPGTPGQAAALTPINISPTAELPMLISNKADNSKILVATDPQGRVSLKGLKAGSYAVQRVGGGPAKAMDVGLSGYLAFVVYRALDGGPVASPPPVGEGEWLVGAVPRDTSAAGALSVKPRGLIDVSKSSADILLEDTRNTNVAAAAIIAERRANGPYKDPQDFARRICSKHDIDFEYTTVRLGDTLIIPRQGDPAFRGFSCSKGDDGFTVYGSRYPSTGDNGFLH